MKKIVTTFALSFTLWQGALAQETIGVAADITKSPIYSVSGYAGPVSDPRPCQTNKEGYSVASEGADQEALIRCSQQGLSSYSPITKVNDGFVIEGSSWVCKVTLYFRCQ